MRVVQFDGGSAAVLRIANADAPAARLLISDMALPAGVELYMYGRFADGRTGRVFGPYIGNGPLASGEFWTHPIEGDEIVLELQSESGVGVASPFRIAEVAPTTDSADSIEEPARDSHHGVRTSMFRGVPLTHAVDSGLAIFEGDIILGRADELPSAGGKSGAADRRDAVAITGSQYRWPGGVIPYTIDPAMPNQTRVTAAISHWNTTMAGHVRLIPRTTENAFVAFVRAYSASTCSSNIGRLGYQQNVNVGDYCSTGNMIHEIGHAAGLWHEQARADRDSYVRILWQNIQSGHEYNFNQQITNGDDIGAYNYGSVMHYPATAFSVNGLPTIETIPGGIPIGQRSGLNAGDVSALKIMYPGTSTTTPPATVAVTIASNPTGMPVAIDGVQTTAPTTVSWAPGSVHTIAALNPAAINGSRQTFSRWSDGGAATHLITVPTSNTTYRADYSTTYLLTATAAPVGSVTRTPASADGFYTAGSTVQVTANAPSGYCFAGWTGLMAGTANVATLTMNSPYTIQANFQAGAISTSPSSVSANRNGGTLQIGVSASTGCSWKASSDAAWVSVVSGGTGTGPGVVTIAVEAKKGGNKRSAHISIGGAIVAVQQQ